MKKDYFESGTSEVWFSLDKPIVNADNSGNHKLHILLGDKVVSFNYGCSGKNDLEIIALNPDTRFTFKGSGELNLVIYGIANKDNMAFGGSMEKTVSAHKKIVLQTLKEMISILNSQ